MHREVSVRVFGLTATAPGYVAPRGRSTQKMAYRALQILDTRFIHCRLGQSLSER